MLGMQRDIKSEIRIVDNIEYELNIIEHILEKDKTKESMIFRPLDAKGNISSNFKIEDARELIKKNSLSSELEKVILIVAETIDTLAQNALLKTIEERTAIIIIITKYRSGLLPTVISRLPLVSTKKYSKREKININLEKITTKDIFDFLKQIKHKYDSNGAKRVVENIFLDLVETNIKLNEYDYELFSLAIKAIDIERPVGSVVGMILLRIKSKIQLKR